MAGFHTIADWVRLGWGVVFFLLSLGMTVLTIAKNRHNVRNMVRGYARRYKKYINCMILMCAASLVLCIGIIVSLVDQAETKDSQWGWWISFALYDTMILFVLGNYNHLTSLGYWFGGFLGLVAGVSAVFTSLNTHFSGWILWGTIGFLFHGMSHFYVWTKSQRYYTLLPFGTNKPWGTAREAMEDLILVVVSWTLLSLVWLFLILSDEATDVLVPKYLAEIFYGLLLMIHWSYISTCVVFYFIDEMYGEGREEERQQQAQRGERPSGRRRAVPQR